MSTLLLFYRHKLLRRDARSPGGRDSAGLLVYAVRRTVSVIQRILCFVACPMKRKGRALRVRWKKRCRFPAASVWASGMKAVAAKLGGWRGAGLVPQELGVPVLHASGGVGGGHGVTLERR